MKRSNLKEMDFLQDIKAIQNRYANEYGHYPVNISDWNPSLEFKKNLQDILEMPCEFNSIDYIFSYSFDKKCHNDILSKIGYDNSTNEKALLITPNGSSAILNVLHWLKHNKFERVLAVSPTYFTVFCGCMDYGIACEEIFLYRKNHLFYICENDFLKKSQNFDVIWITSPVYCTSTYFDDYMIGIFEKILKQGKIIVADENLCTSGHELIRKLGKYDNFIGIYSPHKSICVNGNKFSCIVYSKEDDIQFNDWVVPLSGNLLISNGIAVNHFLSDNFSRYYNAFTSQIQENFIKLKKLLCEFDVEYDMKAEGYLVTLYFDNIPGEKGYDTTFLTKLIHSTGTTLIPGIRNHFDAKLGFCFRVNLCCFSNETYYALKRLIIYLKNIK